jgi:hypothetical protein
MPSLFELVYTVVSFSDKTFLQCTRAYSVLLFRVGVIDRLILTLNLHNIDNFH